MHRLRSFIVEDSPIILANLVAMLEELAPVKVIGCAADESSARQHLDALAGAVDLVLVDIFLKSGSGMGVLRSATRSGLNARRVVVSNYATPDLRLRCMGLGAHRVFDKSTDLDELVHYCIDLADDPSLALTAALQPHS